MTTAAQSPELAGEISGMKRRISDLERALAQRQLLERPDTVFVLPGPLYESTSPAYPLPQRRSYWEAACRLGSASSDGPVVVVLAVNGDTAVTISIPAGATRLQVPIELTVARDADLTAEVTDTGADAEDLTIALRS